MPRLSFISHEGQRTDVEINNGVTVMQCALERGVTGINADCGGACQCCTCHVYVDDEWLARLPAMDDMEDAMLDSTAEPRAPRSRLSCQITMSPELDGLVVRLPAAQI